MDKDKILNNFIESKYVRFFVSLLNKTWVYGSLGYMDFDFNLLSFDEFVSSIKREINFTLPYEKESEERLLPFNLFVLINDEMMPLNEENYLSNIEEPGVLIFCTQDEKRGLENLAFFKDCPDGQQFFS
ncbi:MAG: hypothetical protein ACTSQF_05300 [Candidatus Heimdallarchaeaceae archaeon]